MSKNVWLFDCDGTLLNDDKEMTEKTREAIKNLANTPDNYVVFASGRSYEGVKAICEKLGMMDEFQYYICFNGCQTINNKDTEHPVTMTNTLMDPETAEKVVAMANEAGIPCYAITPDHVYEEENIKEEKLLQKLINPGGDLKIITPFTLTNSYEGFIAGGKNKKL